MPLFYVHTTRPGPLVLGVYQDPILVLTLNGPRARYEIVESQIIEPLVTWFLLLPLVWSGIFFVFYAFQSS